MAILLQRSILQQVLKARKEEVFESCTTKIWHERKANVLTFWRACARFSAKKMRISPNFIKNRSRKSQER
jgi:hypothetical protein